MWCAVVPVDLSYYWAPGGEPLQRTLSPGEPTHPSRHKAGARAPTAVAACAQRRIVLASVAEQAWSVCEQKLVHREFLWRLGITDSGFGSHGGLVKMELLSPQKYIWYCSLSTVNGQSISMGIAQKNISRAGSFIFMHPLKQSWNIHIRWIHVTHT